MQRGTQPVPYHVILTVVNTHDQQHHFLAVRLVQFVHEWGSDRLGMDTTLSPDESFSLNVVPGTYDLKAENDEGEVLDAQYNVELDPAYIWYAE